MTDTAEPGATLAQHGHLKSGRTRASLSGTAWSALNTGVSTIAVAMLFYISSRYLTPKEFGLVAISTSVVTIAHAITPAAFGEALVQRSNIEARHTDTVFSICLIAACALYLLLVMTASPLAGWFGEPLIAMLIPIIGTKLAFEMLAVVPNALIVRTMRFRMIAIRTALANIAAAIVCVILLWLGYGIWALALAQIVNTAVAALIVLIASGWRPRIRFSREAFSELASYGAFATGTRALNILRIDQLLIGALGGAAMAGLFNFANRLFQMLNGLISGAFGSVAHSLMSSLQAEQEKVREAFLIVLFGSSLLAFPLFSGMALIADPAIPLIFGEQWQGAVVAVQAFSVIGLMSSVGIVQGALMTSQGRADWWFWYQLVMQAANLPLIIIMVPYGLDAVLIAIMIKVIVFWPVSVALTMRLLGASVTQYVRALAVPTLATLAMATLVVMIPIGLPNLDLGVVVLLQVILGAVFYALTASILGYGPLKDIYNRFKTRQAST